MSKKKNSKFRPLTLAEAQEFAPTMAKPPNHWHTSRKNRGGKQLHRFQHVRNEDMASDELMEKAQHRGIVFKRTPSRTDLIRSLEQSDNLLQRTSTLSVGGGAAKDGDTINDGDKFNDGDLRRGSAQGRRPLEKEPHRANDRDGDIDIGDDGESASEDGNSNDGDDAGAEGYPSDDRRARSGGHRGHYHDTYNGQSSSHGTIQEHREGLFNAYGRLEKDDVDQAWETHYKEDGIGKGVKAYLDDQEKHYFDHIASKDLQRDYDAQQHSIQGIAETHLKPKFEAGYKDGYENGFDDAAEGSYHDNHGRDQGDDDDLEDEIIRDGNGDVRDEYDDGYNDEYGRENHGGGYEEEYDDRCGDNRAGFAYEPDDYSDGEY